MNGPPRPGCLRRAQHRGRPRGRRRARVRRRRRRGARRRARPHPRARFADDPGLTAVFGSYDDAPAAAARVSAFRNLLHHHVHHQGAGPASTFWSGLGAIRRDAFLAAGGFDGERFPHPSIEDVDLGARLVAGGARIVLDPAIQGTHLKAWTLRSMVRTDFARRGVPWVALLLRSGQRARPVRGGDADAGLVRHALNLGWRHRASAAACAAGVAGLLLRRPLAAVAALLVLLGANRDFYVLLARRRGVAEAAAGVGLHAVHHLTALAAVPAGVAVHLRDRRRALISKTGAEAAPVRLSHRSRRSSAVPTWRSRPSGAPPVVDERSAS